MEVHPSCAVCPALCCRDLSFRAISANDLAILTQTNLLHMYESVTEYNQADKSISGLHIYQIDNGFYGGKLTGNCGFLDDYMCSIWGDHPQMCRDFAVGQKACNSLRYISLMEVL